MQFVQALWVLDFIHGGSCARRHRPSELGFQGCKDECLCRLHAPVILDLLVERRLLHLFPPDELPGVASSGTPLPTRAVSATPSRRRRSPSASPSASRARRT